MIVFFFWIRVDFYTWYYNHFHEKISLNKWYVLADANEGYRSIIRWIGAWTLLVHWSHIFLLPIWGNFSLMYWSLIYECQRGDYEVSRKNLDDIHLDQILWVDLILLVVEVHQILIGGTWGNVFSSRVTVDVELASVKTDWNWSFKMVALWKLPFSNESIPQWSFLFELKSLLLLLLQLELSKV